MSFTGDKNDHVSSNRTSGRNTDTFGSSQEAYGSSRCKDNDVSLGITGFSSSGNTGGTLSGDSLSTDTLSRSGANSTGAVSSPGPGNNDNGNTSFKCSISKQDSHGSTTRKEDSYNTSGDIDGSFDANRRNDDDDDNESYGGNTTRTPLDSSSSTGKTLGSFDGGRGTGPGNDGSHSSSDDQNTFGCCSSATDEAHEPRKNDGYSAISGDSISGDSMIGKLMQKAGETLGGGMLATKGQAKREGVGYGGDLESRESKGATDGYERRDGN